ncbi:polyhydroxyalkanoate depolymerase [Undibacterium terreum]|uniref:Poly(3-hydroxybutyrate) depolymerase n=1 Tax=Undibacterium terreum TaxID=1224302 RepID=A0A916U806_9BURK|nr:polyhydroxyalkanoate depolymerase [Undibacterium terreum]GGC61968.1 poly(3-hydroxybutyrate) depolymerase [Undibacterium terreum]
MNYHAYQTYVDLMSPMRFLAEAAHSSLANPALAQCDSLRKLSAACEVFMASKVTHSRPDFQLATVMTGEGKAAHEVAVFEEAAHIAPFATLLHFRKEGISGQPRVLIVAPMSGHFATLLRETIRTMLADHDVYITDWHNARDVPLSAGRFGLDEYTEYVMDFLRIMGPGSHLMAICQPCVPALAAASIMAEDRDKAQPRSLTLMAGPIDCRINPTKVNQLATSKPLDWFKNNLISPVPWRHKGAMRRVYPGFLQLSAFMSMNPDRHMGAFKGLYQDLVAGEIEKAGTTRAFYEEYFAVLDMDAEFYLETIQYVFQEYALAQGELKWRGRSVNPAALRRTALLTVEGEKDDICSLGQTMAAHDLCSSIPPFLKSHHMQAGVGHYGVFSGRRWNQQIYPIVREMIYSAP